MRIDLGNSVTPLNTVTFIVLRVPEEKREKTGQKIYLKHIIAENFSNLGKETYIQIQDGQLIHIKNIYISIKLAILKI